ncbi:hypothetical protein HGP17_32205 [Rhizobium sp. P38BS-XIX]|uniref:hypothetical protein n=1 Tax=Rhizobium sp. P38BS-XIX TaxID=2726740 RepID=UPI001456569B|nr:hypothetical protein [Rhizobium sp. P38BS-XIX]NLS01521.1 hypothetical protein [Rhizobium sp. P38BS-XIX]
MDKRLMQALGMFALGTDSFVMAGIEALGIPAVGAHSLGYIGAIFIVAAFVLAGLATQRIVAADRKQPHTSAASV